MRTNLVALLMLCGCGLGSPNVTTEKPPKQPDPTYQGGNNALTSCERPLVASTSKEAFLVGADGKKITLVASSGWVATPQVRGGFIAVATSELVGSTYRSRLILFDSAGVQLVDLDGSSGGYLSDLGVIATWAPEGGMLVVRSDGSTVIEKELTAAAEFGPNGLLPVWKGAVYSERTLALYDATNRQVTALEIPLAGWAAPIWSGDMLVYIGQAGTNLVLVRQQGALTLTTPIVAANESQGLAVEQLAGNTAVLVTGSWVQVRSKLDLTTGVVTPMEVTVPEGATFAGRHSASLADDGSLVAAFSKDGAAGLFTSLDGKSWQPMGGTVAGATHVQFAGRHGAWLVSAGTYTFGSSSSQAMALLPAVGRTQMLAPLANGPQAEALSDDGHCAAVWTKSGTGFTLSAVDLVKGTEAKLAEVVSAQPPSGASWVK